MFPFLHVPVCLLPLILLVASGRVRSPCPPPVRPHSSRYSTSKHEIHIRLPCIWLPASPLPLSTPFPLYLPCISAAFTKTPYNLRNGDRNPSHQRHYTFFHCDTWSKWHKGGCWQLINKRQYISYYLPQIARWIRELFNRPNPPIPSSTNASIPTDSTRSQSSVDRTDRRGNSMQLTGAAETGSSERVWFRV